MRDDANGRQEANELVDLGAVSDLTKGTFMPQIDESVTLKDRYEE